MKFLILWTVAIEITFMKWKTNTLLKNKSGNIILFTMLLTYNKLKYKISFKILWIITLFNGNGYKWFRKIKTSLIYRY